MEQTGKLKVVVSLSGGQARIGVQDEGTDPVLATLEATSLEAALATVPELLERAREQWAQSPHNPPYQGPPPPPAPSPQPVRRESTGGGPRQPREVEQPRFF